MNVQNRYILKNNIDTASMPLFFTFTNREGKMWSIPYKNTSIGFEIYEPSGKKGILLKKYNCLLKSSVFRLFFKIELERIELTDSLMNILQRYYGENFEYSIFYGTPSVDQKITIQIYRGNSILGYCKIGQSMKVQKLFEYEASMLEFLNKKGVKNIPKKTFEGRVGKENVFLQSTQKQKGARTLHSFGKHHRIFIQELYTKTHEKCKFENTRLYKYIEFLNKNTGKLDVIYRKSILKAVKSIMDVYSNQLVDWGCVHGDFTPWNTCINKNIFFVFDFEYSLKNAPSDFDYWQFVLQTLIYEKKLSYDKIINYIKNLFSVTAFKEETIRNLILYLLYIISFYLMRGGSGDLEIAGFRARILLGVMELEKRLEEEQ